MHDFKESITGSFTKAYNSVISQLLYNR